MNGLFVMALLTPPLGNILFEWMALWPFGVSEAAARLGAFGAGQGVQDVGSFWPWQLVSYSFLHGSMGHLLFNMFALWMFGVQIENVWGSRRFAIFYFACVIGAGLVQMIVAYTTGSLAPTIGASGGVFGILLAFGMMFPDQPIYIYFLFPIKAKWLVIGYGVLELYAGVSGAQSGVANFAHLGGMVFGFFLIQYWRGKLPWKPKRQMWR
jgi:membrane associated rhomboid family serine protease